MHFKQLQKLQAGDKVAILSPSFAAPGMFPEVYELGLQRIRDVFDLQPIEYPTTRQLGAPAEDRSRDLIAAFKDSSIKAVIATIGGDDQVTYIKHLPKEPFVQNPKPFFGYSDNTHFANFLWQCGVPSFYGGSVMTQFAMQGEMDLFTVRYLKHALFELGNVELLPAKQFNEIGLDWADVANLQKRRSYDTNDGWYWDGEGVTEGISWGGCLESIDEILRHAVEMPSLEAFQEIVLITETSEEIPSSDYVRRVFRALGERGILERVPAVLVGRPKSWEFDKPYSPEQRAAFKKEQREVILKTVRAYNPNGIVVQNLDFGHTDPQIPLPYGSKLSIDGNQRRIIAS